MVMALWIPLKGYEYDGHGINIEVSESFTTICVPKECSVEDLTDFIENRYT